MVGSRQGFHTYISRLLLKWEYKFLEHFKYIYKSRLNFRMPLCAFIFYCVIDNLKRERERKKRGLVQGFFLIKLPKRVYLSMDCVFNLISYPRVLRLNILKIKTYHFIYHFFKLVSLPLTDWIDDIRWLTPVGRRSNGSSFNS